MSEALVAKLIEAGTSAALVAEVAMEFGRLRGAQEILEKRRANDRERKRADGQFPRNSTESTESVEVQEKGLEKEIPPNPHKKTTPLNGSLREPIPHEKSARLPDDFAVPEDWFEWAMAKRGWSRADAVEEGECFCRYWQAKGRDAARRSWKKTWQNWAVNSRRTNSVVALRSDEHYAAIGRKYAAK